MKHSLNLLIFLISFILFSCSSSKETADRKVEGLYYDPPGSTVTTNKEITPQKKQLYSFKESGLYISNQFEGGRLNDFYKVDEKIYLAEIKPENAPINNSAWYSFKLWSEEEQNIHLILFYEDGDHRYHPKISFNGNDCNYLDSSSYFIDTLTGSAILSLNVNKDTLWVSGQELFTSKDYEEWINKLAEKSFIKKNIIGYSAQNKPINMLEISEAKENSDYIFIIGRQHPPEVTGAFALKALVETIASEIDRSEIFRKNIKTFIVPLVNPDGVDNGHWRHNINGIDLNRDWYYFNQPEPKAIRDELLKIKESMAGKLLFFIDFHSTQVDVFYITAEDSTLEYDSVYAITKEWLNKIGEANPDYQLNIDESLNNPNSPTSDNWVYNKFNAPGVTYEVGDETDRKLIKRIARSAALSLMELLLKDK